MKKLILLSATLAAGLFLSHSAQGQIISVQFNSNDLATDNYTTTPTSPGYTGGLSAGVLSANYWNGDTNETGAYVGSGGSSSLANLVNSTGAVTTVSESTTNDGFYNPASNSGFTNAGDNDLTSSGYLGSYSGQSNFTLSLTGLAQNTTYNLLVYTSPTNNQVDHVTATAGSSTYYLSTIQAPYSSYTLASSTTPGTYTAANYVEFTLNSGAGGSLAASLTGSTGQGFDVSGFQLQSVAAAPEPSTWAMMLGGLGMLAFCVRRKANFGK